MTVISRQDLLGMSKEAFELLLAKTCGSSLECGYSASTNGVRLG